MKALKKIVLNYDNAKRWVTYDWANSVFATTVASAFFPIMLRNYWGKGLSSETVTLYLGLTSSAISLFLVFTLPILGHFLDHKIKKPQKLLFLTALVGGGLTMSLGFLNEGTYHIALLIYGACFVFFALGNTQCDGMLLKIAKSNSPEELHSMSSRGYLFGYLGGGLLLLLQALMLIFHKNLGFESTLLPAKICFITAGLWWIGFSIPLLGIKNLKENAQQKSTSFFTNSLLFLKSIDKKTLFFLMGFFLYIDVVFTMYKMAVDFGLSLGLSQNHLIGILIYVQIVGVPGTLFMNWVSKKFSLEKALYLGILCYSTVVIISPFAKSILSFTALATLIGLAQGGLQALSRSHFASLMSKDQQGLGFGFLNVFGKLSAILGPLVVGISAKLMGENTYSILTLLPFLICGALFIRISFKVKD